MHMAANPLLACSSACRRSAAFPTALAAQTPVPATRLPMACRTMERARRPMDPDIVVTAQRRAESVQRVPVAVTAVRGDTLQQAQHYVAGQQLTPIDPSLKYKQSGPAPAIPGFPIRGIGTSSFSAGIEQSISTVVDGVVLGDSVNDIDADRYRAGSEACCAARRACCSAKTPRRSLISFTTVRPKIGESEA